MATYDASIVPALITITKSAADVGPSDIQAFGRDVYFTLQPGDVVKVVASNSTEVLYWLKYGQKDPDYNNGYNAQTANYTVVVTPEVYGS